MQQPLEHPKPKHLIWYQSRISRARYPSTVSQFSKAVRSFHDTLLEKFELQKESLDTLTLHKIETEIATLDEALTLSETTLNDRNLEMLCRCLIGQETTPDILSQFIVANLNAILYKVDRGDLAVHSRGIQYHETILEELEKAHVELERKTQSLQVAEEVIKHRDESWLQAFEKIKLQYEENVNQHFNQFKSMLDECKQLMQAQYYNINIQLAEKDQVIQQLVETNHVLAYLNTQEDDITTKPGNTNLSYDVLNVDISRHKLSKTLHQSMQQSVFYKSPPVIKRPVLPVSPDKAFPVNVPEFEDIEQKFNTLKKTK